MPSADDWIEALNLEPHPEGGHFSEVYRASETIPATVLPEGFASARAHSTSIYFLLRAGETSVLHRIRQDELWHFHDGDGLLIHQLADDGHASTSRLGLDLEAGERPQAVVPAGTWFGAELGRGGRFALVGCTVAPGFDFADFEMAERAEMLERFPQHASIVQRLTR